MSKIKQCLLERDLSNTLSKFLAIRVAEVLSYCQCFNIFIYSAQKVVDQRHIHEYLCQYLTDLINHYSF